MSQIRLPVEVPVAGCSYHVEAIKCVAVGDSVHAVHDPTCVADINAVVVRVSGERIGYLSRVAASSLVARAGAGVGLRGRVSAIENGRVTVVFEALDPERSHVPLGALVRTRSGLAAGELVAHRGTEIVVRDRSGDLRAYKPELVTLVSGGMRDLQDQHLQDLHL